MAWQAPTFDVTGQTYMVDPAPVTKAIQDSGNIQRDVLRGLASTVKAGFDVQSDIMARRQLAEMNASIANIDPTSPTYYQDRANILASNQMAFENPKTANTAKAILGGLDTAFATNARQQEMRMRSDLDLERLDVSDRYQRGRMSFEEQLRSQRPGQSGAPSLLGGIYGQQPTSAPVSAPSQDISSLGLEDDFETTSATSPFGPDLPSNPGPDGNLLNLDPLPPESQAADEEFDQILNPGDAVPAQPAPVAPTQTPGVYQQSMDVTELAPVGNGQAPSVNVTEWEFEDIATPKGQAQVAAVEDLAQMPGAEKASRLRQLNYALNREGRGADPALVTRAQQDIAALEVDPEVRAFEAAKAADEKNRLKALTNASDSGVDDTAGERAARVKNAVDYELATGEAAVSAAEQKVSDLRAQARKSGAPEGIETQVAAAVAEASAAKAALTRAKAASSAKWDAALRADPNAFRKVLAAEAEEAQAEDEFNDLVNTAAAARNAPPETEAPAAADTPAARAIQVAKSSVAAPPPAPEAQQWNTAQIKFDETIGDAKLADAIKASVKADGTLDTGRLQTNLEQAWEETDEEVSGDRGGDRISATVASVTRPWYASNAVSAKEMARVRSQNIAAQWRQSAGIPMTNAASKVGAKYLGTEKR